VWSWGGIGHLAEVAAPQPVAVAFEDDDFGVVDEPVDHGGGDGVVAEGFTPAIWPKALLELVITLARS
jgi:hypothetical protein